jgi:hypothetical protein
MRCDRKSTSSNKFARLGKAYVHVSTICSAQSTCNPFAATRTSTKKLEFPSSAIVLLARDRRALPKTSHKLE